MVKSNLMADDILKNIWNELSSKGKTDSEFDTWKTNVYSNEEVQNNVYGYLKDNGYTNSEFSDWKTNVLPAKTNDSASADPAVESQSDTGSQSENGSSGSRDASDFENTQEKATAIERTFGKNEFTDFVGDIYRAWDAGTEAGGSVNEAFDVYKGKDSTDKELYAFLDKTRNIEEKGQTDEMIGVSEKMAELKKEGYNGVSAFFGAWWNNPTAMLQYTVMSLSQMGRALVDSEEVAGTAAAVSGAAALTGGGTGAALTAWSGPGALFGAGAGAISGAIGGFFGGLSGAMETGMTTAALIQEEAVKDGLDWGNLSDKERFDYVRKLQNDTEKFNQIKSNALARGVSIGAIDGVVGAISGGVGTAARTTVAAGSRSALAGAAKVASVAALETTGGMLSEVAGQAAAGQEFNLEEILIEGFADKTFTGISLAQAATQGTPKYILNGQKLNGKQFSDALKIMSDEAYVSADIKIENSPAVQQLVNNRRQDIAADQKVDSRINDINDRATAIKLTKEQNSLKGNQEGNKTRLDQIKGELNTISEKYADSDVDVTIEQRQQAVAEAVDNKFESNFNKNYKAASEAGKKIGLKTTVYKTDLGYKKAIEKAFGKLPEGWDSSEGVFAGNGKLFINKAKAKRSIDISTGNTGAISVASHEVLHPIFNALIGDAKTQSEFVQQFRKRMTSKQKTYVDSQIKKRGYGQELTGIELMNIFSDGIIKNEITYDQTFFEKVGESIIRLFKGEGFDRLSFDNGQDVYNFLKEYNTSIKEGKLSDKAITTIKEAETKKKTKVSDAKLLKEEQFSKTLTPEQNTEFAADISTIKSLAAENAAIAKKFGKEPIKGAKQSRLEQKVLAGIKTLVDKVVTNRTKALYDPIADDAKRNVSRQEFKDSMKVDLETMALNEYNGSQELEKFIVNRGYLRANNLAKRLGIESQEDGGIKADVDSAKNITNTKDEQTIDRSGAVERGQATFDELDIVDDKLISEIELELSKELKLRARKGTLSQMVSVKKGRETYFVSWLEDFVDKKLFKKILKKWGAIGESKGVTVIPPGYIDFLNSKKAFDIVTKALPIRTIKKSYAKLFKIEKVGRELTPEGNPIYKIAPIEKKTFLQYFLDGKKNTILERQKQLAREIITPVTKEIVANYANEENISNLEEIQELAPQDAIDVANKIVIEAQLNDLESKIDRYKGEKEGFDIIQFSITRKDLKQINEASKTELDSAEFIKFPKRIRDFIHYLHDKGVITGNSFGGLIYEEFIVKTIKSAARKIPGLKVISNRGAGYNSQIPDITLQVEKDNNKSKVLIEVKKNRNVRFGQVTLGLENGEIIIRKGGKAVDPSTIAGGLNLVNRAGNGKEFLNNILSLINKEENTSFKNFPLGTSISKETYKKVTESKDYKDFVNLTEELNQERVAAHYNAKGVYYIQIGGKGLYYMGKDILNTGVPELNTAFTGSMRFKKGTTKNGRNSISIVSEPKMKGKLDKSNISLETKEGSTELYNSIQFSKTLNEDFNNIIEGATGIKGFKVFSEAKGKVRGQNKGKFKFFIPPSADDFAGLVGRLLGKGEQGNLNAEWFKKNLFNPFAKGIRDFETYKEQTTHMVKALKKRIKNVPNGLNKVNETGFTNEAAVRVYLWAKNGYDISGLSKTDQKDLIKIINENKALKKFAEELNDTFNGYPEPNNDWLAGTVTTDIINMVNTTKRAEFLEAWQEKADIIFSKENINKLRAAYGDNYVEALQDMLYRMKTGRNRPSGANKLTNKFMNWVNDSVGTIMFFNTRSALLQTLSIANFINWGDNNPAKAAMAFANQKQFWADFSMLFNSNFLKQRRSGLKNDVNADDIANAAESATNKSKAVLSSILKIGFLPTQIADSFAIAMGGASFIRNRINKYVSEGMDTKAAEEQAFLDFQEVAEETQQSSRPDRISQQQASPLGRIILAFANTPMQYMRLTKKAFLDLVNKRGDAKTNISRIVYYTFVQNIIFSALQSALFASMFEDDDEEAINNKQIRVANSMLDSILRGVGIYGAIASTGKNIVLEIDKQAKKGRPDFTQAAIRSLDLSPPLSSKVRKLMSAGRAFSYSNVRDKMTGYGLDNPAFYAGGQVVSALTNVPLDRAIKKADNIRVAVDNDTKLWQSIALLLGYSQWDLGLVETSANKKKSAWGKISKWKKNNSWKKEWKSKNK